MKFKISYIITSFLFLLLFFLQDSAFAENFNNTNPTIVQNPVKQDAKHYLPKNSSSKRILTEKQQIKLSKDYLQRYFAPWSKDFNNNSSKVQKQKKKLLESQKNNLNYFTKTTTWGENFRPHDKAWSEAIKQQMNLSTFPNQSHDAIIIRNTYLRELPTDKPAYYDFAKAGEGFPFDNLQNSSIWVGTPIHVLQTTKDGDWVFVIAPYSVGWIAIDDIAYADDKFKNKWRNHPFIMPTKDYIPIKDEADVFRFKTHIGMLFPKIEHKKSNILIPLADNKRQAQLHWATLPATNATVFPMQATYNNMANEINQLLDEPYGWGGLFGHRDCSQTLRDYYSLFGIWLPRNSTSQLKAGKSISLAKVSNSAKDKTIIEKGVPYLTLIGRPGHVMLYIGEDNKKALVFHNKWGLHTHDDKEGEGRAIIGRSNITDLHLGENLKNTESLMNTAQVMAIIATNS